MKRICLLYGTADEVRQNLDGADRVGKKKEEEAGASSELQALPVRATVTTLRRSYCIFSIRSALYCPEHVLLINKLQQLLSVVKLM